MEQLTFWKHIDKLDLLQSPKADHHGNIALIQHRRRTLETEKCKKCYEIVFVKYDIRDINIKCTKNHKGLKSFIYYTISWKNVEQPKCEH